MIRRVGFREREALGNSTCDAPPNSTCDAPPNSSPSRLEARGSVLKILQYSEMEC